MTMPRRTPAIVAAGALAALSALTASGTGPAQASRGADPARHAKPAASLALLASSNATFRVAKGVGGNKPHRIATLTTKNFRSVATGIDAHGNGGLVCADSNRIYPVRDLRTKPKRGRSIDVSAFTSEGGASFGFFCDGVSLHGSFALATGDSLGVLQLVRKHHSWKVDRRVHSAGLNEAGHPHKPGWIRFPGSLPAQEFDNVSIAPRPLKGGKYLAVAFDRPRGTLVVLKGVGTPHPRVVGSLSGPLLAGDKNSYGNGGVAWQPGAHDRALITTSVGFAVLDLRRPGRPLLRGSTRVGSGDGPVSITISADGNHVAVADDNAVYGYGRVRAAVAHGKRFKRQTRFRTGVAQDEEVRDVAYTADDDLIVLHGVPAKSWALTVVKKVTHGHHAVKGSMHTTEPDSAGSLSVWPAP
jgi:hypothetical protein